MSSAHRHPAHDRSILSHPRGLQVKGDGVFRVFFQPAIKYLFCFIFAVGLDQCTA